MFCSQLSCTKYTIKKVGVPHCSQNFDSYTKIKVMFLNYAYSCCTRLLLVYYLSTPKKISTRHVVKKAGRGQSRHRGRVVVVVIHSLCTWLFDRCPSMHPHSAVRQPCTIVPTPQTGTPPANTEELLTGLTVRLIMEAGTPAKLKTAIASLHSVHLYTILLKLQLYLPLFTAVEWLSKPKCLSFRIVQQEKTYIDSIVNFHPTFTGVAARTDSPRGWAETTPPSPKKSPGPIEATLEPHTHKKKKSEMAQIEVTLLLYVAAINTFRM